MSNEAESAPRLWLADLIQADPSAERLGRLVGLGRVEGVLVDWRSIAGEQGQLPQVRWLAQAGWDADQPPPAWWAPHVRLATSLLLPLHERSNGRSGFVAAVFPPGRQAAELGRRAEELARQVNRPNLVVGFPCDPGGLEAARNALSEGQPTLITSVVSFDALGRALEACAGGLRARREGQGSPGHPMSLVVFDPAPVARRVEALLAEQASHHVGRRSERSAALGGRTRNVLLHLALAQVGAAQAEVGDAGSLGLIAMTTAAEIGLPASEAMPGPTTRLGARLGGVQELTEEMARLGLSADWEVLSSSRAHLEGLTSLGISVDEIGLQEEARVLAMDEADYIRGRRATEAMAVRARMELGELAAGFPDALASLDGDSVGPRLWRRDVSLWTDHPAEAEEASRRLGWLTLPEVMQTQIGDLLAFAREVRRDGLRHVVVLGMGGSSLAPDVFRRMLHPAAGMQLHILDSTDPETVDQIARATPPGETLYVVSSKSGTTTEPLALLEYFWATAEAAVGSGPGGHFVAVTDPGTPLQSLANTRRFRRVFAGPSDVGGRYSALSVFGMLPAALLGADIGAMLTGAADMARHCGAAIGAARNPGLHLGAFLALAAERSRDKLTFLADEGIEPLEDWVEQLIAESSGKKGTGILPITVEPPGAAGSYGRDRAFAYLRRAGEHDSIAGELSRAGHPVAVIDVGEGEAGLGAEFFRWEFATAVACHRLGVSAFDQPDVQRAKDRTSELLKAYRKQGSLPMPTVLWQGQGAVVQGREDSLPGVANGDLTHVANEILSQVREGDALCFLAYLPCDDSTEAKFQSLRAVIRDARHVATSLGFGPRYLHSTGQMHKGGPDRMVFVLLTADRPVGVAIPGMGVTFNLLQRAQAVGDLQALLALGRRAYSFHLDATDRLPGWFASFQAACESIPRG
jgi:transaldolase/glucose-6-phosphate isomerase